MRLSPKYLVTVALLLLFAGCGEKVQERTMVFELEYDMNGRHYLVPFYNIWEKTTIFNTPLISVVPPEVPYSPDEPDMSHGFYFNLECSNRNTSGDHFIAFDFAIFADDGKPFQFGKEYKGGTCRILEFISSKNMFFFDGFGYSDEIPKGYDYGSGVSMEKGSLSYSFEKKHSNCYEMHFSFNESWGMIRKLSGDVNNPSEILVNELLEIRNGALRIYDTDVVKKIDKSFL